MPRAAEGSKSTPEVRKFILQQANYLRKELRLYLRVTDDSGSRIYKTTAIGPLFSFSRPVAEVDKHSNLHVLYSNAPQSYSYTIFNPQGELIARQTHDYIDTRPHLQAGDGEIKVTGGVRRLTANDVPARPAGSADDQ